MFEKFCDYMYSLLFTPLKKVRQSANQFYIFFRVIGTLFDDCKRDIFRVREESMVISASEVMLPEHGRDRNITRYQAETVEGFRKRLCMKALLAEKAGTMESLELCLKSLGYTGEIIPYFTLDPARWAEFLVKIYYSLDDTHLINMETIKGQIRGVKPASAKDNYVFDFYTGYKVSIDCFNQIHFIMSFYPRYNLAYLHLDGTWGLNGAKHLNGYNSDSLLEFYPIVTRYLIGVMQEIRQEEQLRYIQSANEDISDACIFSQRIEADESIVNKEFLTIQNELQTKVNTDQVRVTVLNKLDGYWKMDSSRKLNGGLSVL
ncbi:MAG: hypothetical protein LBQ71_12430 [Hungatella sp.]|jgi:hypothetical protein|nr:hypothetical protein [Hungatella sp.]